MRSTTRFVVFAFLTYASIMSLTGIPFVALYFFLMLQGQQKRAEAARTKLQTLLMPSEQLVEQAIEYRINALFGRRSILAITTSRVILLKRNLLGGYKMVDHQWKDLSDVQMEENNVPNIFGAYMSFSFMRAGIQTSAIKDHLPAEKTEHLNTIRVIGIDPSVASTIYGFSQSQEQAWEEKRRIRVMEEKRASAGGVNIHGLPLTTQLTEQRQASVQSTEATPANTNSIVDEINRAKSLLDMGAISDVEYQEIKSKILNRHFH